MQTQYIHTDHRHSTDDMRTHPTDVHSIYTQTCRHMDTGYTHRLSTDAHSTAHMDTHMADAHSTDIHTHTQSTQS